MSTDVFDLAPHEQEAAGLDPMAVTRSIPTPLPEDFDDSDPDKLPFLGWLWRRHVPGDEFYPLAHLVLSGGPGDVWARKTYLVPSFVARDVAEFYATGRHGITAEHLELANSAVQAYRDNPEQVSDLVAKRRRADTWHSGNPEVQAGRELKAAMGAGFTQMGALPAKLGERAVSGSGRDMVPDVSDGTTPDNFRPPKMRCTHQYQDGDVKICGRPTVVGSLLCARHGGVGIAYTPEELKEVYSGARQRLIAATMMAVDTCIDLAQHSTNDMVRLKAAEVILDRTGFVPGVEVHLPGQVRDGQVDKTPAEIILERLQALGVAAPPSTPSNGNGHAEPESNEFDVVEAEVVEERP